MDKEDFHINYDEDKHIDETNLHLEWLDQSDITQKYVYYFAHKKMQERMAEKRLSFERSMLDKKIRKNPSSFGVEKITDEIVKQAIIRTESYQQAWQKYIEAQYEASIAYGALEDMRERRRILEGLNYLYNVGYYSVPEEQRSIVDDRRIREEYGKKIRVRERQREKDINNSILNILNQ